MESAHEIHLWLHRTVQCRMLGTFWKNHSTPSSIYLLKKVPKHFIIFFIFVRILYWRSADAVQIKHSFNLIRKGEKNMIFLFNHFSFRSITHSRKFFQIFFRSKREEVKKLSPRCWNNVHKNQEKISHIFRLKFSIFYLIKLLHFHIKKRFKRSLT